MAFAFIFLHSCGLIFVVVYACGGEVVVFHLVLLSFLVKRYFFRRFLPKSGVFGNVSMLSMPVDVGCTFVSRHARWSGGSRLFSLALPSPGAVRRFVGRHLHTKRMLLK